MSTRNEKKPLWQSVYELFPITNRLLLVKRLEPNVVSTFVTADSLFSIFSLLYQAQLSPNLAMSCFQRLYFRCFRGLEKAGFSEKKSCWSKNLFVDHRASRTSRTHDSSERRQHFISIRGVARIFSEGRTIFQIQWGAIATPLPPAP